MSCDKNDINFYLKHGVITDALHDFKGYNEYIIEGTDISICPNIPVITPLGEKDPNGVICKINEKAEVSKKLTPEERLNYTCPDVYNEDKILFNLLEQYEFRYKDGTFTVHLLKFLKNKSYNFKFKNIGYNHQTYDAKLLHQDDITYLNDMNLKENNIIEFLGSKDVYLLIDAANIKILKILQEIKKKTLNVNQIINREVINDSASKSLDKLETINQYIDETKGDIVYSSKNHEYNRDKFFSKYDLILGPIEGKDKKLRTHFQIKDNHEILFETLDSDDNNKTKCKNAFTENIYSEWPIIYQRKRSGDWLQALSCLDKSRIYKDEKGEKNIREDIILVTCDLVLLYYAIIMGVNILFTTDSGELIYFKNVSLSINNLTNRLKTVSINNKKKPLPKITIIPKTKNKEVESKPLPTNTTRRVLPRGRLIKRVISSNSNNEVEIVPTNTTRRVQPPRAAKKPVIPNSNSNNEVVIVPTNSNNEVVIVPTNSFKRERNSNNAGIQPVKKQKGGSQQHCNKYLEELANDLEGFDTDENSDYKYYENVAFIVIACIEYYKNNNPYTNMQTILFEILPSVEGYIRTDDPEMLKLFEDKFTADCTSFAARNVALHALGLRTGSIDSHTRASHPYITDDIVATYNTLVNAPPEPFYQKQKTIIKHIRGLIIQPPSLQNQTIITENQFAKDANSFQKTHPAMTAGRRTRKRHLKK
jgi:hypothetical protein